jgi:hypothetical protein
MSVHKKLMIARVKLQNMEIKKSGLNKFAGYSYFELGDFIPPIQSIFSELGLCGVVSFNTEYAQLCITDVEDGTVIVITSPMAEANLKGAHPIQNLGAVLSYQRRYLWMAALEIVEGDAVDSAPPVEAPKPVKVEPKPEPKPAPKPPVKMQGAEGPWQLKVTAEPGTDVDDWIGIVVDASRHGLAQAGSEKDVMDLFKINRGIFDKLKELSLDDHVNLMADFKTKKDTLKGNV